MCAKSEMSSVQSVAATTTTTSAATAVGIAEKKKDEPKIITFSTNLCVCIFFKDLRSRIRKRIEQPKHINSQFGHHLCVCVTVSGTVITAGADAAAVYAGSFLNH